MRKACLSALVAACVAGQALAGTVPASDFYALAAEDVDGKQFSFSSLKGARAVVVTNVASACGYTAPNYGDFGKLSSVEGVHLVVFPCNQFGQQEPGSNADVKAFAQERAGLKVNTPDSNFHMMGKADVNGGNAHPVFDYLKRQTGVAQIRWNFMTKFVIACDDGQGTCDISSFEDVVPTEALKKAGLGHVLGGKPRDEM